MAIKPLSRETASPTAENAAKELMKALGVSNFKPITRGDEFAMLSAELDFESNVLLAHRVIKVSDELVRRGFRPMKWKDEGYIYVQKTSGSKAWMRIEGDTRLSITVFLTDKGPESD